MSPVSGTHDSPESSLDCTRHRCSRVWRLASSQTNNLRPGKRERSCYEHRTHAFEPVRKSAGIAPEPASNVRAILSRSRAATTDADNAHQDEQDHYEQLQAGGPELLLRVPQCSKEAHYNQDDPENGDPPSDRDVIRPIIDRKPRSGDFQGYDGDSLKEAVPAHPERERRGPRTGQPECRSHQRRGREC